MASPSAPCRRPLLRVPPFPGATCSTLVRAGSVRSDGDDAAFGQAKAALASARVGGDYWGAQPPLPRQPYSLVSIRDGAERATVLARLTDVRPVVSMDALAREHQACDPWHLLSGAADVHADVDDELLMIASLAGVPAFGADGSPIDPAQVDNRLRRSLYEAGDYVNPFSGDAMGIAEAIELAAHWRTLIDANRSIASAVGFAAWKRKTAAPLLWGGTGHQPFDAPSSPIEAGKVVAAWKSRTAPVLLERLGEQGTEIIEVEDGFIRSIGLGAECVPPLSLVVDRLGAYFDPQRPSDLEKLLQDGAFSAATIDRARILRALIVEAAISKYGAGRGVVERRVADRVHVLVAGQVEDDRSVQCGGGEVKTNVELLRRVRAICPAAYILYKPHPDVEAGHRIGRVLDDEAAQYADEVVRDLPIPSLIEMVDEVHVNTSLAGFEALLRDRPVTTHGVPFYAGWGLTRDLGAVPDRRTARRTLDELVAAVLLLYPRYLDPVTGLPCTPEILIRRLSAGATGGSRGLLVPLRRLQGFFKRHLAVMRA